MIAQSEFSLNVLKICIYKKFNETVYAEFVQFPSSHNGERNK
jgi:hypothetical protein